MESSYQMERRTGDYETPAPISEILRDPALASRLWPDMFRDNPALDTQLRERAGDTAHVIETFTVLTDPTVTIEDAISDNILTEQTTIDFYTSLTHVLDDETNSRLALYLPFEIIPSVSWQPAGHALNQAVTDFRAAYMQSWYGLLDSHDVRANFTDGDILEDDQVTDGFVRVVKAAHFIPQMLKLGLINEADITRIVSVSDDPVLIRSLADVLPALDAGSPEDTRRHDTPHLTERRRQWMAGQEHENRIKAAALLIANGLAHGGTIETVCGDMYDNDLMAAAIIDGIAIILEESAPDPARTAALYLEYADVFALAVKSEGNDTAKEHAVVAYRKLFRLGVVSKSELDALGIGLPNPSGPASENLALIEDDVRTIDRLARGLIADETLRDVVYPVALIGGSNLKGYGTAESDVDVSVFIRPDVPAGLLPSLQRRLSQVFTNGDTAYDPVLFWLDTTSDGLAVHDFTAPDIHTADSYWTHILFNGAWTGDESAIRQLQRDLLPTYFNEPADSLTRRLHVERLEQDTLQYRLMHKGYDRLYPRRNGDFMPDSAASGADSAFWDPGFRQLATRLYLERVFIPVSYK